MVPVNLWDKNDKSSATNLTLQCGNSLRTTYFYINIQSLKNVATANY